MTTARDFTLGAPQTHASGGWSGYRTSIGDVDADQDADLIWGSGVTDWEQFSMLLADVTGDGRADIIWNHAATTNRLAVGLARAP